MMNRSMDGILDRSLSVLLERKMKVLEDLVSPRPQVRSLFRFRTVRHAMVDLDSDVHRSGAYHAHNVSQFWYKEKMSREDGKL